MIRALWILAGGNGAGKSTFYKMRLESKGIFFVNADEIAKKKFPDGTLESSMKAQEEARVLCHKYLADGTPFCFETVFSHESKLELIQKAKYLDFEVVLVYIHLESEDLNVARVLQRVNDGGHPVPEDKIRKRIPRIQNYMRSAIKIADYVSLLDNSDPNNPFEVICKKVKDEITFPSGRTPQWAIEIIQYEVK